ncbi:MAG: hypothetical protein ACRDSP_10900 [Pseudonocardiaceae bacterium]
MLEQETPGPRALRRTARLPADLAIDPPHIRGIGDSEHVQDVRSDTGQA